MAFIGTPLDTRNTFQSLVGKRFNGDGSTTAFTLDVAPSSTLDIEVFVGNVRQDPNSAYTLSGTTLTFTGAPPSGTNNIYVVHQAKSVGTINAPDNSVDSAQLNTALLTGATDIGANIADADLFLIDDGAGGTLRKTAASRIKTYAGFSVSDITGATALATQPAATDEIVLSDAGTLKRLDVKHISNTPAIMTRMASNQGSVANGTETKLLFATEDLDSDGTFASNKFTPGIAGRYFVSYAIRSNDEIDDGEYLQGYIYKNGAVFNDETGWTRAFSPSANQVLHVNNTAIVQLDSDDYLEIYVLHTEGGPITIDATSSHFAAFRLTGMES